MPTGSPVEPESATKPKRRTVTERLAEAESELDRLRRENDQLVNESLSTWLLVVDEESSALAQVYATLSWRITRPLRITRQLQLKVREVGVRRTAGFAAARLKQLRGRAKS
ncbi:MAG: hypothetical protein QOE16_2771 [Microbacteriaceae bacterium]|jgi:hypothetical protein|nr:hypothetical protein [Microbacteriaceae bacterium]